MTNYGYDTKNQLLSEQSTRAGGYTFSFAYDLAQNPTTFKGQSRSYNVNNQLIGAGFSYDGNGNPVLYTGVSLAFDPENRMTAYGNVLTAGYNGDGLRAWKQTATGRRYYLYDGEELTCELDAAGNVAAPIIFGANGLLVYGGTAYQFDPQGNAVHLLNDTGYADAHLAYDAWGQPMSGTNPTPYGYKAQWGYYTDAESGILLLTHRYLDPATGRFLTRDPIGVEGGVNLYAYVGNGVVMLKDPSGRMPLAPIVGILLRECLVGVAGDMVEDIGRWLACAIYRGIRHGMPGVRSCGPFPVPSLCDLLGGCIGGMLGGEWLKKLPLPEDIKDKILDLLKEIAGSLLGGGLGAGLCEEIAKDPPHVVQPKPRPPRPTPSPIPVPVPSPGQGACGSGGAIPRPGPPPAM